MTRRGPLRFRGPLVLGLALAALPVLVGSSRASDEGPVPGSDPAAAALLDSAARAEATVSYRAVEILSDADADALGERVQVLSVSHVAGRGTVVVVGASSRESERTGLTGEGTRRPELLVGLLQRSYRLVLGGRSSVAGIPAAVVVAQRPDGGVAARFWVDPASGLLLRRQVLGAAGAVASTETTVTLALGAAPATYLPPLLPSVAAPAVDQAALARWRSDGWPCPGRLGTLSLFDARTVAGQPTTLHLTYSDGLSTASLFVQRGRLADRPAGAVPQVVGGSSVLVRPGRPRQVLWSAEGYVLTVVTDLPRDLLPSVLADLPRAEPEPTGWSRVVRGAARFASWLNPFD